MKPPRVSSNEATRMAVATPPTVQALLHLEPPPSMGARWHSAPSLLFCPAGLIPTLIPKLILKTTHFRKLLQTSASHRDSRRPW